MSDNENLRTTAVEESIKILGRKRQNLNKGLSVFAVRVRTAHSFNTCMFPRRLNIQCMSLGAKCMHRIL
jgi:hypothetical protein